MNTSHMSRRRWLQSAASFVTFALLSGAFSACGNSPSGSDGDVTKLELGCNGDLLAFDTTNLAAPAGASVELTFHNRSNHHQHNWVLVNGGEAEAATVYEAALAAGLVNDWLPSGNSQIIVHTPLLESGKSATIRFSAPVQPGSYAYLCTFPGHFLAGMKGTLTIT